MVMMGTFQSLIAARCAEAMLDHIYDHKDAWIRYANQDTTTDEDHFLRESLEEELKKAALLAEKQENELRSKP